MQPLNMYVGDLSTLRGRPHITYFMTPLQGIGTSPPGKSRAELNGGKLQELNLPDERAERKAI